MALEAIIAPLARRDVKDIVGYIRAEDEAAALRLLYRLEKTTRLLTQRPHIGPRVNLSSTRSMRRMSVPPYIIFYTASETELIVLRVLHASRDLTDPTLFE